MLLGILIWKLLRLDDEFEYFDIEDANLREIVEKKTDFCLIKELGARMY